MTTKTIEVKYLARVEGEGSLTVQIKDKKVTDVRLKIFEPPRFFEAMLRGRNFLEAPDITSRICGICPVAYQTSAVHAIENACSFEANSATKNLRRLLYLGEWIESHSLHVYMLHAPDSLGFESGIHMAKKFPDEVKRGLELKKIGNELLSLLGGREIHPINLRVGGFYRFPTRHELQAFQSRLKKALGLAVDTLKWASAFTFPDFERDYEFVSLQPQGTNYPVETGRLISNKGLNIEVRDYEEHFEETHVPHSTALHSVHKGFGSYFVGPLARFNLNFDRLSPIAKKECEKIGFLPSCKNPFKSILARSAELIYACEEGIRIIEKYERPGEDVTQAVVKTQAKEGFGCTEAPRGILYHRYRLKSDGLIEDAKIVPPTSQNQKCIEEDLWRLVEKRISWPKEKLTLFCEQAIRNYDPCISCSTHFLKVTWNVQ